MTSAIISDDLTEIVYISTQIPKGGSQSAALSINLFLLTVISVLQWVSLCLNSDHAVVSISTDFPSNSKDVPFHHTAFEYFYSDWNGLYCHLIHVLWENMFNLKFYAAAEFFCHQNKSSLFKGKFRQVRKCCKRPLEAAKFAYASKEWVYHFLETWLSWLFENC